MLTRAEDHDLLGLDPETIRDPYGYIELAREKGPVWREPYHGVYIVTGYDDIVSITRQPELFSSVIAVGGPFAPLEVNGESPVKEQIQEYREQLAEANGTSIGSNVLTDDPPEHTGYRKLLNQIFSPRRMQELDPMLEAIATQLIDAFIDDDVVDFANSFAQPLTFTTIATLLGMPEDDRQEVLVRLLAHPAQGTATLGTPENAANHARNQGTPLAEEYFDRYIRERREEPRDDHLTRLATLTLSDGTLPPHRELVKLTNNLFTAGQDSTKESMTGMVKILAKDEALQQRLREDEELIGSFVEEALRYLTPAKLLFRLTTDDAEVSGVTIPAGSIVMLSWVGANRDERVFDDAAELCPHRENAHKHLAFGHGPHFCVGNSLARMELRVGLRTFLRRTQRFWLDDADEPQPLESWLLSGWKTLSLHIEAAA